MREHGPEPIRGLPEQLPDDERILWQGAPDWRVLSRRALHTRKVAIYFALIMLWRAVDVISTGGTALDALIGVLWLTPLALTAIVLLGGFAFFSARTTVYTLTDKRLVFRIGVALPVSINLPFARIAEASLKAHGDGTGDIALRLTAGEGVAYPHIWPHARRWHIARPQPTLRCIAEPDKVAQLLADALAHATGGQSLMGERNSAGAPKTAGYRPGDLAPAAG
ncbi:MAG: photosynthetic complex putative assembly protein PuhB [Geminicoccaceae bacterium]